MKHSLARAMKLRRRPFRDEYILAKGFPIFIQPHRGGAKTGYVGIQMAVSEMRFDSVIFKVPEELLYNEMPKFELVLRRKLEWDAGGKEERPVPTPAA
jgi:hypothetical protein